ncbi:hypothetical protein JOL79_27285 [Microbispora sp. RL4-1S]|uniref:Uncharacterized protein n=1 Tax=Microbispora oryzae TaxID=2806554 RepID=A0A940WPA0_9ACTN|nr:hypothetical protein [Microbispora oryzae]
MRLVAWDGTGLDAADTPANAAAFGVTQGGSPQVRLLALIECGTHAVIDAAFDGVAKASEQKPARRLAYKIKVSRRALPPAQTPELTGIAAQRHFSHVNDQARSNTPRKPEARGARAIAQRVGWECSMSG